MTRAVRAATCKPPGAIDAGPVPAVGATRLVEADVRLLVARDASGVYAMSGMCTHMGAALFLDPVGNALEFKSFTRADEVFAR